MHQNQKKHIIKRQKSPYYLFGPLTQAVTELGNNLLKAYGAL